MSEKKAEHFISVAKEELVHALNTNKDNEVRKVYLSNAIRFIEMAVKEI